MCTLTNSESLEQDSDDSEEVAIKQGGGRKRKRVQTAEPELPAHFQAAWDVWDGVPVHIPPSCVTIVLTHHPQFASPPVERGIPEVKLDPVPVHFDVQVARLSRSDVDDLWGEVTSMMAGAGLLPLQPGIPMAPPSAVATTVQTTETIFVE